MTPAKTNLLDLDQAGLVAFFASIGEKPFRAQQVMKWIYHQGVVDLDGMTNLSRALREKLHAMAEIRLPEIVVDNHSTDGTHKWLMRMDNINSIETVLIPEPERATLCVSSQVGCALECSFCSTAQQGFNRNLSTAEILGQVWQADRIAKAESGGLRRVTNVVLMGMGEPLLNFNNVVTAMNMMTDDWGFGLSKRRVTISTSGVVPALYRLREVSDVSLAVSLHAPFDELRDELVPVNKKYPLEMLIPACANYIADKPHRSITWEYVMLDGVNDHPEHARMLVKLLKNIPSKVNLIPFNPFPGTDYRRSRPDVIRRFQEILQHSDLVTTIRKTRGDDIDAACGQLVGRVNDKTRRQERRIMPILAV